MLARWLGRIRSGRAAEITPAELGAALEAGERPLLIDIRSAAEFAAGHLPRAVHMPPDQLELAAARFDPAAPAVVY